MSSSGPSQSSQRTPVTPALVFIGVPLLTFGLTVAGSSMLQQQASLTYYQTIGFLVPSLLVTLALQGQFFRTSHVVHPRPQLAERHPLLATAWLQLQRVADVLLLAYLAAGEFAALYVLATNDAGVVPFALTGGSVTTAFVALGIVAVRGTPWTEGTGEGERKTG